MAHSLEDIWDELQTIGNKVQHIKSNLNDLMDPEKGLKIWKDCAKCHGDGLVLAIGAAGLDPLDVGGTPPEVPPATVTCPICNGAKRFQWGWQETNPSEQP